MGAPVYIMTVFPESIPIHLKQSTTENVLDYSYLITVELQWLEHLWNRDKMFETGVVRATTC